MGDFLATPLDRIVGLFQLLTADDSINPSTKIFAFLGHTKFAMTNNDWSIKLTERVSSGVMAVFDRSFEDLESLLVLI